MYRASVSEPPCKRTSRHGGARVYSPGGCGCALLMFPVVAAGAGIALALTGVALMAAACLIAAIGFTVFLAATADKRRERGKTAGGSIAIPIVLYAVSIPYLLFFWWLMSQ